MRAEAARWALVLWPDTQSIGCIPLDNVDVAIERRAILIGKEWEIVDTGIRIAEQSNPRRQLDEGDQA